MGYMKQTKQRVGGPFFSELFLFGVALSHLSQAADLPRVLELVAWSPAVTRCCLGEHSGWVSQWLLFSGCINRQKEDLSAAGCAECLAVTSAWV